MIEAGDGAVTAIHTPGHCAGSLLCFATVRDLFCGDLIRSGGTIVIPASRGGDLTQYLASLQSRAQTSAVARLLPGHGPIIDDPGDRRLTGTCGTGRYARRRSSVRSREGHDTPERIVSVLYEQRRASGSRSCKAAVESVLAHLIKLSVDGKARQDG